MDKIKNVLDGGTVEERLQEMKEFLGLTPEQSFEEIDDAWPIHNLTILEGNNLLCFAWLGSDRRCRLHADKMV